MADQLTETDFSKIYKTRSVLLSQLERRGFDVSDYTGFSISEIQIMTKRDARDMLVENSENHKVYIKYHLTKQPLRSHALEDIVEDLFEVEDVLNKKTDQVIVLTRTDPNDTLKAAVTQLYDRSGYHVIIYPIKRLMFDILEHDLVPSFTVLTNDEKDKLFEEYNILDNSQLPEMSRFDPVSLAIGIRPGQVTKIIRKSKTAMKSETYRICV